MTENLDLFVRTPRQRAFVELAGGLANRFAERAGGHDRNNSFPTENFDELKASGYVRLTIPVAQGGLGANLTEMMLAQERLAQGDGATALSIGWHVSLIGKVAETGCWPAPVWERIAREVVERGVLMNSVASEAQTGSPSRGGRPFTTARRLPGDGGWVLNGRKAFTSMAPVLDYPLTSARIEGEEGSGWFIVPMRTAGIRIDETWDNMGMRATASHDMILEDVHLPAEALVEEFGKPGAVRASGRADGAGWSLHIPAVYVGIARAAREFALDYARNRRTNSIAGTVAELPHIQMAIGQMELDLLAARSALYTVAQRWDEVPELRHSLQPSLAGAKVLATNLAIQIVDRAMRITGIAGLSRKNPIERYYRDVRAGLHNPPMEDAALTMLARAALKEAGEPGTASPDLHPFKP